MVVVVAAAVASGLSVRPVEEVAAEDAAGRALGMAPTDRRRLKNNRNCSRC